MSLTRREFLSISLAVLSAGGLGAALPAAAEGTSPVDLSLLSEKIGEHYLSLFPKERDLPRLRATLHFASGASDEAAVKAALLQDIHDNYAGGHAFRYQGWVLSRTEGRLCAYKFLIG